jgi:hypothetical protein
VAVEQSFIQNEFSIKHDSSILVMSLHEQARAFEALARVLRREADYLSSFTNSEKKEN